MAACSHQGAEKTWQELRSLLFTAEQADKEGEKAEEHWLQLAIYLDLQEAEQQERGGDKLPLHSLRKTIETRLLAQHRQTWLCTSTQILFHQDGDLKSLLLRQPALARLLSADVKKLDEESHKERPSEDIVRDRNHLGTPAKKQRTFSPPRTSSRQLHAAEQPGRSACQWGDRTARDAAAQNRACTEPFLEKANDAHDEDEKGRLQPASNAGGFRTAAAMLGKVGNRGLQNQPGGMQRPSAPVARRGTVGRGGFVPPFANKGVKAEKAEKEEEGPLSAKTLELLGGQSGKLPESLEKVDPNLLELVCNEILDQRSSLQWDDIAGQEDAKCLVQELVVWPMRNPEIFKGARAPPKGLLLFGPPGTGKTLIGRAIASNVEATFFSISAGSLTSKWIGEGEKMVRALFAVARVLQPAVIFVDEIDSILSARKSDGEHESSRRLKTELLVQMEGVNPSDSQCRILLVGATNRPEELDEAARRRMPKQLYIPLPCDKARESMLLRQLGPSCGVRAELPQGDIARIVKKTAGYSGSDMRNLIQEACQGPVRDAVKQHGAEVEGIQEADLRPVILRDFQMASRAQRASVEPSEIVRYEEYNKKHGAKYGVHDISMEDEWSD